jgi:GNAT superfamily N-acetyltransferase
MLYEIRKATEPEIEDCWAVEAPHWGNGNVNDYKKLWSDHCGTSWVLTQQAIVVANMTVFEPPAFCLPEGSIGTGCLFVRQLFRRQGFGPFLLQQVLRLYMCGPTTPAFGWSDIDPQYYVNRGWKIVPPLPDPAKICPRCRHAEAPLIVYPASYEIPQYFVRPVYF